MGKLGATRVAALQRGHDVSNDGRAIDHLHAEALGANRAEIDRWRVHNLPGVVHYFKAIIADDPAGNRLYFAPARLIARLKHLPEFKREVPGLRRTYEDARERGVEGTELPTQEVFAAFDERN